MLWQLCVVYICGSLNINNDVQDDSGAGMMMMMTFMIEYIYIYIYINNILSCAWNKFRSKINLATKCALKVS